MRWIFLFIISIFSTSCSEHETINIELSQNNCVIFEQMEKSPFNSETNYFSDNHAELAIVNDNPSKVKILRMKNISNSSIFFLDTSDIPMYSSLNLNNNNGSLWITNNETSIAYDDCMHEKNYSISVSQFNTDFIITIILFSGMELRPNAELDIEIKFEHEGNYRTIVIYKGKRSENDSIWGLNKSNQVVSEKFIVKE